jgi:hypothetical protein
MKKFVSESGSCITYEMTDVIRGGGRIYPLNGSFSVATNFHKKLQNGRVRLEIV